MKNPMVFWGSVILGIVFIVVGLGYLGLGNFLLPLALEMFH